MQQMHLPHPGLILPCIQWAIALCPGLENVFIWQEHVQALQKRLAAREQVRRLLPGIPLSDFRAS